MNRFFLPIFVSLFSLHSYAGVHLAANAVEVSGTMRFAMSVVQKVAPESSAYLELSDKNGNGKSFQMNMLFPTLEVDEWKSIIQNGSKKDNVEVQYSFDYPTRFPKNSIDDKTERQRFSVASIEMNVDPKGIPGLTIDINNIDVEVLREMFYGYVSHPNLNLEKTFQGVPDVASFKSELLSTSDEIWNIDPLNAKPFGLNIFIPAKVRTEKVKITENVERDFGKKRCVAVAVPDPMNPWQLVRTHVLMWVSDIKLVPEAKEQIVTTVELQPFGPLDSQTPNKGCHVVEKAKPENGYMHRMLCDVFTPDNITNFVAGCL